MFNLKFDEKTSTLELLNVSKYPKGDAPIKMDIKPKDYDQVLVELGLNVLIPIEDCTDFIYAHTSTSYVKGSLHDFDSLIGRSFAEVYPFSKDIFYPIFKRVYETHEKETIKLIAYEKNDLVLFTEIKVLYGNGEIFFFIENKTEQEVAKVNKYYSFDRSPSPKFIIQNNHIIRANKSYLDFSKISNEEILSITPEFFDKGDIVYNNTGLVLSFSQIINNILKGEHTHILFNLVTNKFDSEDNTKLGFDDFYLECLARIIEYQGEDAVECIILRELNSNKYNKSKIYEENMDNLQKYTKSALIYHDLIDDQYYWGKGLEGIVGGSLDKDVHLDELFGKLVINESKESFLKKITHNIQKNNFYLENEFRISDLRGNIKYIKIITQGFQENNKIVRFLYIITDITKEISKTQELKTLHETLKVAEGTNKFTIYYMDSYGIYYWSSGVYDIVECEEKPHDGYRHVILDAAIKEDRLRVHKLLNKLGPNELLGNQHITIKTPTGKTKHIILNVKNINDEEGNLIQRSCYCRDITEEYLRIQEISTLNATVSDVQQATNIGIHYMDADGNYHWTPETYKILERPPRKSDSKHNIFYDLLDEESKKILDTEAMKLKPNEFLGNRIVPITLENGLNKFVQVNLREIYDEKGNFIRRSAYTQDVTDRVNYENALIQSDSEKTVLIKEVHHRVKNNLQVILSLISLEEKFKTQPTEIVNQIKNRINSLALIHESIYNQDHMGTIGIKDFIEKFDENLSNMIISNINFINELEDITLSVDLITPLILIINELSTNSFKYAFSEYPEDKYKEIYKSISKYEENNVTMCKFIYKDNGIGLKDDFDMKNSNSLGSTLIHALSNQLDGDYEIYNDNGFNFVLKFPIF